MSPESITNICKIMECEPEDIQYVSTLEGGLTNKTWHFELKGGQYVYRQPGVGTEEITNRRSEAFSQKVAAELGIDNTFIYEDADEGWKISHFIETTEDFSCHNEEHLQKAMVMLRKLHGSGAKSEFIKDMHEDTLKQIELLTPEFRGKYDDFEQLFEMAERFDAVVKADGLEPVLCHNDFYDPNFLIRNDEMYLIDWEYSGMSDYASDLAVFICCADFTYEEAIHVLETYFQRPLTEAEMIHCIAYIQVISFHWLVWALYMAQCGEPVGPLEGIYHEYASSYGQRAQELLNQ